MGKDKKVGKAAQGITKPLPKLTKKLKLDEDPDSGNQTARGASTEAENNLRILKCKKVWKAAKGTSKLLVKLREKKLKLEEDPSSGDQTVEGASTEAKNNLRILKEHKKNKAKPMEKKGKLSKRKRGGEDNKSFTGNDSQHLNKDDHVFDLINSDQTSENGPIEVKEQSETVGSSGVEEACIGKRIKTKKLKKVGKSKRSDHALEKNVKLEKLAEMGSEKVDEISSVDEDCSRGMKKWLINYKESRQGLKILKQRIDEFITAYEAQQEQERREREALAAEGGWTVVVHHKGRKKTTDSESGTTVGSVAQAAVLDNMGRKKNKEVALDFYRFKKQEAQRSEVMMLRSKFEQDKKHIQQLRAARKFRPY
ncbi:hypothetical protein OPV22_026614 [Ensete ventricosum]|uniref:Ribosomal RNA-processing protein 7 C-terminal domain-containing protein n=2 Tax=Ensete ventricosum TaxID=4639 RepID=A0AAV8PAX7_ENSVE|nr:hypothetical protein OPV22_026614 [Ensete ventricosum]